MSQAKDDLEKPHPLQSNLLPLSPSQKDLDFEQQRRHEAERLVQDLRRQLENGCDSGSGTPFGDRSQPSRQRVMELEIEVKQGGVFSLFIHHPSLEKYPFWTR